MERPNIDIRSIPSYNFYKNKYGDELLIDVVHLDFVKKYMAEHSAHTLTYFDITLITKGEGEFCIDDSVYHVKPHDLIFTKPGEVRKWDKNAIQEGFTLIFEEEFLLSFFNDPYFLRNLSYFKTDRVSPYLSLTDVDNIRISGLIMEIEQEIRNYQSKDKHLLRALLYEVLMLLNRLYANSTHTLIDANNENRNVYVDRFRELVDHRFSTDHTISGYADQLCITPNYLNEIVKNTTGLNAKQYIQNKLLVEAKRLLAYTNQSVSEISQALGYDSSSYFIRFFRIKTGVTPLCYRKHVKP